MKPVIRPSTKDDLDGIVCIARELNVMHARAMPSRFRVAPNAMPDGYFDSLMQSPDADVLVADRAGDILGYEILEVREAPDIPISTPRRYAYLNAIAVRESEQGQGVGRLLIEAALEWARARGTAELELGVLEFNDSAIAFYEYLGFTTVSRVMALDLGESARDGTGR